MQIKTSPQLPTKIKTYFSTLTSRGIVLSVGALLFVGVLTTVLQVNSVNELKHFADQQQSIAGDANLLNNILLATVDAETGQRGYLLTGDATYLDPYNSALPTINVDFKKLGDTSQSNQDKAAIDTLRSTVIEKMSELQSTLNVMNVSGSQAAISIVDTDKGLTLMNSIRSQIRAIEGRQNDSLNAQRVHVLGQISAYQTVLVAVRLSALAFLLTGMYLIGRLLYQRYELEKNKGEFIDIVAHQLRTPASVVKLQLGAILSGYMGKASSEQVGAIQSAYDSNEREIQIIEDVLRVAKVDNGSTVVRVKPENINKILNASIRSTAPMRELRKQNLVRDLPKKPVSVNLDAMYIQMVLENLLDNASKYSLEKTEIAVSLEFVGPWALIRIADNGVGISKRDKLKLFKKFSRIHSEISDSISGSGLGLYWSQQIAELHGGRITVQSVKGEGSTFTLVLPYGKDL